MKFCNTYFFVFIRQGVYGETPCLSVLFLHLNFGMESASKPSIHWTSSDVHQYLSLLNC